MSFNTDRLKLELKRARVPALQYVFLTLIFAFCMAIFLKNQFYKSPLVDYRSYEVAFTDAKGVNPGVQRVRLAGVDVGVVDETRVGKNGRNAIVKLSIKKKYGKLYRDAQLRLRPLTPLQDMIVSIESRGTAKAGELPGDEVLSASRTVSPVDISRVMNRFDDDTRVRMQALLDQFGRGLDDNGVQLEQAFAELAPFLQAAQRTTREMSVRRRELARLVTNLNQITVALGDRDDQLASMIKRGNSTMATLAQQQGPLDQTLAEIPPTLSTMRTSFAALRSAEQQLDPAFRGLKPVTSKLESGLESLGRFGRDARPSLASLERPVNALRPLTRDLQPTSRSLARAVTRFRPQAPQLDHITSQFVPCRNAVQDFFHQTISVTKFYDAYGAYPRGDTIQQGDAVGGLGTSLNLKRLPMCTDGLN